MKTIEYLANTSLTIEAGVSKLAEKLGINYQIGDIPDIIAPSKQIVRYFGEGFLEQFKGKNLEELIRIGVLTAFMYTSLC
ncbi:hypothetical protein HYV50_05085 [Candidatus Pacearchaeota archaeon]|nr:hypothetical protein [Candidatus Pacearchaeota archaeon]